jgi:hypothetical protein
MMRRLRYHAVRFIARPGESERAARGTRASE